MKNDAITLTVSGLQTLKDELARLKQKSGNKSTNVLNMREVFVTFKGFGV